jgi:hypothetical protein
LVVLTDTPVAIDTDIDLRPDVVQVIDDTVRVDDKGAE